MGTDSNGVKYGSLREFWNETLGANGTDTHDWYKKARDVWESSEASVEGVMQGFTHLDDIDTTASMEFLDKLQRAVPEFNIDAKPLLTIKDMGDVRQTRALDCGAGVGRVTKKCLLHRFHLVDLVEPVEKYLARAKEHINSERVVEFYCSPLQDFIPKHVYDCIWIQWAALYLTDSDMISFLERSSKALKQNGFIFVKENVVLNGGFYVDKSDNSIIRTADHWRELFKKAGLGVVQEMKQRNFPMGLFPVMMYCVVPLSRKVQRCRWV